MKIDERYRTLLKELIALKKRAAEIERELRTIEAQEQQAADEKKLKRLSSKKMGVNTVPNSINAVIPTINCGVGLLSFIIFHPLIAAQLYF